MQRRPSTAESLWCSACKTMHPRSDFGKDRNGPEGLTYACKAVIVERNRKAHDRQKLTINARHKARRRQIKLSDDRVIWALKKLIADARRRAVARGLEFRLSPNDLVAPLNCPIFRTALVYQADVARLPNSASLDRIDSRLGYTPENVWIISWRANQIKSDATPNELRTVADAVDRRVGKKAAGRCLDGVEHNGFPVLKGVYNGQDQDDCRVPALVVAAQPK